MKIMMEDNPERKAWFIAAQERLLREEDLEDKLKRFISQNNETGRQIGIYQTVLRQHSGVS